MKKTLTAILLSLVFTVPALAGGMTKVGVSWTHLNGLSNTSVNGGGVLGLNIETHMFSGMVGFNNVSVETEAFGPTPAFTSDFTNIFLEGRLKQELEENRYLTAGIQAVIPSGSGISSGFTIALILGLQQWLTHNFSVGLQASPLSYTTFTPPAGPEIKSTDIGGATSAVQARGTFYFN